MDCDRRDLSKRLMELDDIVAKYDFSGLPIISAAIEKAHNAMLNGGDTD